MSVNILSETMHNQTEEGKKEKKFDRFLQQKLNKQKPKFMLLMKGFAAKDDEELKLKEQHFLSIHEVQQLIITCFIPAPKLPFRPDWFKLERVLKAEKIGIFILDSVSDKRLARLAKETVRFEVDPGWIDQLLTTNLSRRYIDKINNDNNLKEQLEVQQKEEDMKMPKATKLDLLLSPAQMLEEGYLFPKPMSEIKHTIRKRYLPVTENSPMFAIDCEMVRGFDNQALLARVSVVDEHLNLVLDTLVKPDEPIQSYVTRFSGITREMLDPVDITLSDVKKILKKIIPRDAIICGQSLNGDLRALKTFHPYVIDTSVIYNLTGIRQVKTGLATLSANYLGMEIQKSKQGHCSIEDARATMQLVNLKLGKGKFFADAVLDPRRFHGKTYISLSSFFHLYEADVKIFHDYTTTEHTNRFISVLTHLKSKSLSEMASLAFNDKSICIVLTKDGYCYINV